MSIGEFLNNWRDRVQRLDQKHYGKREVEKMLDSAISKLEDAGVPDMSETCRGPIQIETLRRGDVFIHKLIGGKVRPWIVLKDKGEFVIAVSMSSSKCIPGAIKSKCRLWPNSWITPTITTVSKEFALKEVTRPYTDHAHLEKIEQDIMRTFEPQRITSIAQILQRMRPTGGEGPVVTQP